jgi:hypothetical protein
MPTVSPEYAFVKQINKLRGEEGTVNKLRKFVRGLTLIFADLRGIFV